MNRRKFLFDFTGRIPRREYWMFVAVVTPLFLIAASIDSYNGHAFMKGPIATCASLLLLCPSLAVQAKRWHDRDSSGWWVLINFIPVIGGIAALIVNGFLKGTVGANQYGEDPLEQKT